MPQKSYLLFWVAVCNYLKKYDIIIYFFTCFIIKNILSMIYFFIYTNFLHNMDDRMVKLVKHFKEKKSKRHLI